MARPGVTYKEVVEAANLLIGQGKNPTIEQIRLVLGTGSSTTIANHLRDWKESQTETNLLTVKENVPPELMTILKGLWERVIHQSEEKVSGIEANFQQSYVAIQDEMQKYKHNNRRWQQLFNQWMKEKFQLEQYKEVLERTLEVTQVENIALHTKKTLFLKQLQEKQERIDELHHLHRQAQMNLEHYRATSREQHLQEQEQFANQLQDLQRELSRNKANIIEQQEKMTSLQQAYYLLESEYHLQLTESKKIQLENKKLQDMLETTSKCLIEAQTEVKWLFQQSVKEQQALAMVKEQNALLTQEKWFLSQEKIQLAEQLRCQLEPTPK